MFLDEILEESRSATFRDSAEGHPDETIVRLISEVGRLVAYRAKGL